MKTFSKPLTPEEEAYYLKEYHSGNEEGKREAKDVLTLRNLRRSEERRVGKECGS